MFGIYGTVEIKPELAESKRMRFWSRIYANNMVRSTIQFMQIGFQRHMAHLYVDLDLSYLRLVRSRMFLYMALEILYFDQLART